MKFARKLAIIFAVSFFFIGLSATSGYAQRGRYWHHDNGRHLGWYKHNNGRHLGWYKNGRYRTRYYGYYPRTSAYYPYGPRRYYYRSYRVYRPAPVYYRRSGLTTVIDSILR